MLLGTIFAIREINDAGGLDGREIVPIHFDPQSTPLRYAELAARLIDVEHVNVIFGCYMSSTRKAVLPIVERFDRLLFYPSMYEGFEFSPNIIYTGGTPNQHNLPLARYMMANFGARVYMVGGDYIFPYESNRTMSDLIHQRKGGRKIGEKYVSLDAQEKDFAAIARDIRDKQPDFVFSTVVGRTTRMFYQAYADAGLDPATIPIASLTTTEVEVQEMGSRLAAGHFTAAPYFRSLATPKNVSTVGRFTRLFGDRIEPNMCWEAAYFQVHLFAQAFLQAGGDEPRLLVPHLHGAEFDAPQGRVRIDPITHHTRLTPRIGRVDAQGQFTIMAEAPAGIEADPYLANLQSDDWTQALRPIVPLQPTDRAHGA